MLKPDIKIFIHGKLPKEGDFVFRGNNNQIHSILEDWTNQYIEKLSIVFPAYKEYWLSAPIWSFCTPFALFGSYSLGFLINSYDRVQRQYPLVIIFSCPNKDDFLLFLNKKFSLLSIVKEKYQILLIDDLLKELTLITQSNDVDNLLLYDINNEVIINTISRQKSLWWAEGRKEIFIQEYINMPTSEDLMLYYGL